MLYKALTVKIGTPELDDALSRQLSRMAKEGFIFENASITTNASGDVIAHYLLRRVAIAHLPPEKGDPPNLKRIRLGQEIYYWDPCGDDPEFPKT